MLQILASDATVWCVCVCIYINLKYHKQSNKISYKDAKVNKEIQQNNLSQI